MSRVAVVSDPGGLRALLNLESDFEYMQRVIGPQASVMALNSLRKKIRTRVTDKVWKDARYLPLRDAKGRKVRSAKIRTGIHRAVIYNRVYTSKATRAHTNTHITGYIKDIPLTSLGVMNKKTKIRKLTMTQHDRKTVGKRAKVQKSSLGGLSIGGQFLYQAFIQKVNGTSGENVQVFRRDQKATWAKGRHGWNIPKGTPSGSVPPRAPYTVLKAQLGKSFDEHFKPTVEKTVEEEFFKEYNRALNVLKAKLLQSD